MMKRLLAGITGMAAMEGVYGRYPRPLLIHDDQDTIIPYHVAVDTYGLIPHTHIAAIPGAALAIDSYKIKM